METVPVNIRSSLIFSRRFTATRLCFSACSMPRTEAAAGKAPASSSSRVAPRLRKKIKKQSSSQASKVSAAVAKAIRASNDGDDAEAICFQAAVLAGKALEEVTTDGMLDMLLDEQHTSVPACGPGPPFPWEWASLSDGSYVSTGWGAARGTQSGPREIRTAALKSYATRQKASIDWKFGRKLMILRELRWEWAGAAAEAAAKELGCKPPPLKSPRGGDLLPPLQPHLVPLVWNQERGVFERET